MKDAAAIGIIEFTAAGRPDDARPQEYESRDRSKCTAAVAGFDLRRREPRRNSGGGSFAAWSGNELRGGGGGGGSYAGKNERAAVQKGITRSRGFRSSQTAGATRADVVGKNRPGPPVRPAARV